MGIVLSWCPIDTFILLLKVVLADIKTFLLLLGDIDTLLSLFFRFNRLLGLFIGDFSRNWVICHVLIQFISALQPFIWPHVEEALIYKVFESLSGISPVLHCIVPPKLWSLCGYAFFPISFFINCWGFVQYVVFLSIHMSPKNVEK